MGAMDNLNELLLRLKTNGIEGTLQQTDKNELVSAADGELSSILTNFEHILKEEEIKCLTEARGELLRNIWNGQPNGTKLWFNRIESTLNQVVVKVKPHLAQRQHPVANGQVQNQKPTEVKQRPDTADQNLQRQRRTEELNVRSKKAGDALRLNNPEIADLSDVNRPTKLAEHFSQLYDDAWTDAFEDLTKHCRLEDRHAIKFLLDVVETAYEGCVKEAKDQIRTMANACHRIVTGEDMGSEVTIKDQDLFNQLRKQMADKAIRLFTKRFRGEITKLGRKHGVSGQLPPSVDVYVSQAIPLCWWMCAHLPPVHLVPTTGHIDPRLYRAYTTSGETPQYVVWPALQLHKDGALLYKGVAQFK